jgi:hypothetical protein
MTRLFESLKNSIFNSMATSIVVAHTLAGNNPVKSKTLGNFINRALDPKNDADALLFEELDGFHSHATSEHMGDSAGCQQPGKLSGFMAGIQDKFLVNDFVALDMVNCITFTVAEV